MNETVNPSETVILCEGFYDRAFWDGWLKYLGCASLKPVSGHLVSDPFNIPVKGPDWGYNSLNGKFIRVRSCDGKNNVRPAARVRLKERTSKLLRRLVINVDLDLNADGTPSGSTTMNRDSMERLARQFDTAMTVTPQGILTIDGGLTEICLIRWKADDPPSQGLPNQQTLERLVCASICAAYPLRGRNVQEWLDTRHSPTPVTQGVKEYVFSYMAGWEAESGCFDFYSRLWEKQAIADEMKTRLQDSGAWQIAQMLANEA